MWDEGQGQDPCWFRVMASGALCPPQETGCCLQVRRTYIEITQGRVSIAAHSRKVRQIFIVGDVLTNIGI